MAAESTQESNRANLGDLASFETMDARAYLHTYWPPELPMDSEGKVVLRGLASVPSVMPVLLLMLLPATSR